MKLSDFDKTRKIEVPGTDLTVEISEELSWSDYLQNKNILDAEERGVDMFCRMIKKWNITDDDGKEVPVTEENIRKLPFRIAAPMLREINKAIGAKTEKKKDDGMN